MATLAKGYIKVRLPTIGKKRSCAMNTMSLVILVHLGFPFITRLYHRQGMKTKRGQNEARRPFDGESAGFFIVRNL